MCYCLNLILGEGTRSLSHLQGDTERGILQANGAKSRLIHRARGLFWASFGIMHWPRRKFVAFLRINNQPWSTYGKIRFIWQRTSGWMVLMKAFSFHPYNPFYLWKWDCLQLHQEDNITTVWCYHNRKQILCCFQAYPHGGFKFYLIYRWFCEMTIVKVSWGTQGALVAIILVVYPPAFLYCLLYWTKPTITIWDTISTVVYEPWPAVSDGPESNKTEVLVIRFKLTLQGSADPLEGSNPKRMETTGLRGSLVSSRSLGCKPETLSSACSCTQALHWSQWRVALKTLFFCGYWKNFRQKKKKV